MLIGFSKYASSQLTLFITGYNYWFLPKINLLYNNNISLPFIFLYNEGDNLEDFPMEHD